MIANFAVQKFPGLVGIVSGITAFDLNLLWNSTEENITKYFLGIIDSYQTKFKRIYFNDAFSSEKWGSSQFAKNVLEYSMVNNDRFGLWQALELIAFRESIANRSNESRQLYPQFQKIDLETGVWGLYQRAHHDNLMAVAYPQSPNLNMLTLSRLLGVVGYGGNWRKKDYRKK